jgi:hypothetical protein
MISLLYTISSKKIRFIPYKLLHMNRFHTEQLVPLPGRFLQENNSNQTSESFMWMLNRKKKERKEYEMTDEKKSTRERTEYNAA